MEGVTFKKDIEPLLTEDEKAAVQTYIKNDFPSKSLLILYKEYEHYSEYFAARSSTHPPFNTLRLEFRGV